MSYRRCCRRSALGPDRRSSPLLVGGVHSTALCRRDTPSHSLAGGDRGDTPTSDTPPRSGDFHRRESCRECTGLKGSTGTHTLYTYIHTLQYTYVHYRTHTTVYVRTYTHYMFIQWYMEGSPYQPHTRPCCAQLLCVTPLLHV